MLLSMVCHRLDYCSSMFDKSALNVLFSLYMSRNVIDISKKLSESLKENKNYSSVHLLTT